MNEILLNMLYIVITGCSVAIAKYIVNLINNYIDEIQGETKNNELEKLNYYVDKAQTAIEKADQIIRLSSPDLKSMSFYLSQLSVYSDSKYRLDEHIHGINTPNVDVFMPIEEAKAQLGEVSFTLPFSRSVKEQMQQGKLHVRTSDKRFESRMQDIASQVVAYGTD